MSQPASRLNLPCSLSVFSAEPAVGLRMTQVFTARKQPLILTSRNEVGNIIANVYRSRFAVGVCMISHTDGRSERAKLRNKWLVIQALESTNSILRHCCQ